MLEVIDQIQPKKILEIGVHTGGGLQSFGQAFPDAELFGIEIDAQYLHFKDFHLFEGDGTTREMIDRVAEFGPYDFIFIDGDHTYNGVKADWENYKDMVAPGGAVGFHDTSRVGEGWMSKVEVRPFLEHLTENYSYKYVEFRNGWQNPGTVIIWPES